MLSARGANAAERAPLNRAMASSHTGMLPRGLACTQVLQINQISNRRVCWGVACGRWGVDHEASTHAGGLWTPPAADPDYGNLSADAEQPLLPSSSGATGLASEAGAGTSGSGDVPVHIGEPSAAGAPRVRSGVKRQLSALHGCWQPSRWPNACAPSPPP